MEFNATEYILLFLSPFEGILLQFDVPHRLPPVWWSKPVITLNHILNPHLQHFLLTEAYGPKYCNTHHQLVSKVGDGHKGVKGAGREEESMHGLHLMWETTECEREAISKKKNFNFIN